MGMAVFQYNFIYGHRYLNKFHLIFLIQKLLLPFDIFLFSPFKVKKKKKVMGIKENPCGYEHRVLCETVESLDRTLVTDITLYVN